MNLRGLLYLLGYALKLLGVIHIGWLWVIFWPLLPVAAVLAVMAITALLGFAGFVGVFSIQGWFEHRRHNKWRKLNGHEPTRFFRKRII